MFHIRHIARIRTASLQCACRCHCSSVATSEEVRVRFAPSPTGQLHIGGLRTALYNYLFAKSAGGKFILRIEDTDQSRLVPGATEKLMEMLKWSKITIDEGPFIGGHSGPYIQNGTAYRCFCSQRRLDLLRKEALRQREIPKYDNKCRYLTQAEIAEKLGSNTPHTVRFKLEHYSEPWDDLVYGPITTDVANIEGDPIIMKTDGYPTYHFANIVDDHLMKITHVLRGMEWQVSTTKHLLLYRAFGWSPPKYAHLPLLLNKDGKKLSKRQGDIHVEHFKNLGLYPESILNLLTSAGSGFKVKDTAGMNMNQLVENFDLGLMNTNSTRVDLDKLNEFNRLQLDHRLCDITARQQIQQQLVTMVTQKYGTELSENPKKCSVLSDRYVSVMLDWAKSRIYKLDDLLQPDYRYLWVPPSADIIHEFLQEDSQEYAEDLIQSLLSLLENIEAADFKEDGLKTLLKNLSKERGLKFGHTMKVFRAALSGLKEGPSIAEMISTLGKESTISRLQFSLQALRNR